MAAELRLSVAEKAESMELCFAGEQDYRLALEDNAANRPGDMMDMQGRKIGMHKGIANYTLGQRRGLGFAGGMPLYVGRIDAMANTVALGTREEVSTRVVQAACRNTLLPERLTPGARLFGKIRSYGDPRPCRLKELTPDGIRRWNSTSLSYGGEIETPNLDRLAGNGLRFSQCYSTGRCWPSRTCLLTGYYPQQVRMDPPQGPLPAWTRVVPHYLKPLGYRCYHSGKWHLMGAPKAVADGGFDRSYVLHDHDRFFTPKNHELDDRKLDPVEEGLRFLRHDGHRRATPSTSSRSTPREHRDEPFYCYLAFTSPHFPLHALQEDIARYRDRYLAGLGRHPPAAMGAAARRWAWSIAICRRWRRMRFRAGTSPRRSCARRSVRARWTGPCPGRT